MSKEALWGHQHRLFREPGEPRQRLGDTRLPCQVVVGQSVDLRPTPRSTGNAGVLPGPSKTSSATIPAPGGPPPRRWK